MPIANVSVRVDQFIHDHLFFENLRAQEIRRGNTDADVSKLVLNEKMLPALTVATGANRSCDSEHLRVLQHIYDIKSINLMQYFRADGALALWREIATRYSDNLPTMSIKELKPDSVEFTIRRNNREKMICATISEARSR